MKTEQLINNLTENLKPSMAGLKPQRQVFVWLSMVSVVLFWRIWDWSHSTGLFTKPLDFSFYFETGICLLLFLALPYLTWKRSLPGQSTRSLQQMIWLLLSFWLSFLLFRMHSDDLKEVLQSDFILGYHCSVEVFILGALPALALFWIVHKNAPVRPARTGFFAGLACGLIGASALQLICQHPNPLHVLLFHFGAALLLAVLGSVTGLVFFRW